MDTKELQENLILYLDSIGRVIIGEEQKERTTASELVVRNPVIIHVEPKNGSISIQFFPIVFKDFLASSDDGVTFTIPKNTISIMDKTVFDFKLYAQYSQMMLGGNAPQGQSAPSPASEPQKENDSKVIKLFDD